MQPISENLKRALERSNPVYKKTIELQRRLWNGSAYVYDSAIDITDYLLDESAGVIMWKLDKEEYGVFNLDNVTLTFRNDRNQWKQDNPKGMFPDSYLLHQSKIVISIGAELADGSSSVIRSFTGYIDRDPIYNIDERKITMTLVSAMSVFEKTSAEVISTAVADEAHPYSAPGVFAYNTANNGVAATRLVVKRGATADGPGAATEIKPTTGYTISNQNQKTLPLTVTLVTALTTTESIWITYIYWHQDKLLEWLAEQVMTLCGITSYSISPAVFSTNIPSTWTRTSKTDWELGTLQNINTETLDGSFRQKWFLIDDFADGDYTTNLAWSVLTGAWSAASNNLVEGSGAGTSEIAATPNTGAYGTWEFKAQAFAPAENLTFKFIHIRSMFGAPNYVAYYSLGLSTTSMVLNFVSTYPSGGSMTLGNSATAVSLGDTIRITRTSDGLFKVYVNGVEKISATHNDLTVSTSVGVFGASGATFGNFWYSHAIDTAHSSATPVYIGDVIDGGASLTAWGKLEATYTLNGGTVVIETYSSGASDFSSDNDPDGWQALNPSGDIQSAIKRYLKVRITLNKEEYIISEAPVVDALIVTYYTSHTVIDLVNLTGMNCKRVLDVITEMPAYEVGFGADDTFVYRARNTSAEPVMDLRCDTNIKSVRNMSGGADRVYNRVVAEYGIYRKVSDASGDSVPNSITRHGTREFSVSESSLLPAENVNLAYAVAPTILAYTKTPRRRCTVETKFILHLELGDKVTVYLDEPAALRRWRIGDSDVRLGDPGLELHTEAMIKTRYNLWGVVMRVEGVEFDFQNWMTSFDLVEVV